MLGRRIEQTQVFATTLTGHGNPATLEAVRRATLDGPHQQRNHPAFPIRYTALLSSCVHSLMTAIPAVAQHYTEHSEVRTGFAAQIFSFLAKTELFHQLQNWENRHPFQLIDHHKCLHIVQGHPLLTMSDAELQKKGFDRVYLYNPDAYPKPEVFDILLKLKRVHLVIWNSAAYEYCRDELERRGLDPHATKQLLTTRVWRVEPFVYEQLGPTPDAAPQNQSALVLKSSGSGMPKEWEQQLVKMCSSLAAANSEHTWKLHTPHTQWYGNSTTPRAEVIPNRKQPVVEQYAHFLNSIGPDTRYVFAYPSEVVMLFQELLDSGGPVPTFVCLPPRGSHEKQNLLKLLSMDVQVILLHDENFVQPQVAFKRQQFFDLHLQPPNDDSLHYIYRARTSTLAELKRAIQKETADQEQLVPVEEARGIFAPVAALVRSAPELTESELAVLDGITGIGEGDDGPGYETLDDLLGDDIQ